MKFSKLFIFSNFLISVYSSPLTFDNSKLSILNNNNDNQFSKFFSKFLNFYSSSDSNSNDLKHSSSESFDDWLNLQENIAFKSILNNIGGFNGGNGLNTEISKGAVIASPSTNRPNYFYQWTRDAAITMNSLIEYLDDNEFNDYENFNLIELIESYIFNNYNLQRLDNPSGKFENLDGLGEPKFQVNCKPFNEHWGRPQRDGPALRSITIINYLNLLKKYNSNLKDLKNLKNFKFIINEIIKPDLNYTILNWNKNGFDVWEEIDSMHLFTSLVQLKSIKLAIELFQDENYKNDNEIYDELLYTNLLKTFNNLRYFILIESGYKNPNLPYLIETPSLVISSKRIGLDIATVIGVLRSHDIDNMYDQIDIPFSIDDGSVLNTLTGLINDMKYRYPINHHRLGFGFNTGFALGRYPEDIYDGITMSEGNPWFISTATASELLYKIIYKLYKYEKDLIIPNGFKINELIIENDDEDKNNNIKFNYNSYEFNQTSISLINYADSFLDVIREHVDLQGHMSEQFNKYSGYMEGAEDLTWSYGAFWSSIRWRNKVLKLKNERENK